MSEFFRVFSHKVSFWMGSPWAFLMALFVVLGWALTGPMFQFSDTWELVINTGTTIITFLMVFLIQNTQNREMKSLNLKLDELIHATKAARNKFANLESLSDEALDELEKEFQTVRQKKKHLPRSRRDL
jgi:low affinity Fe/Cu permease